MRGDLRIADKTDGGNSAQHDRDGGPRLLFALTQAAARAPPTPPSGVYE